MRPAAAAGPARNWNKEWSSKDLRLLQAQVPTNKLGICGCSICGQAGRVITGRVFHEHMTKLHRPRPTRTQPIGSVPPSTSLAPQSPAPRTSQLPPIASLLAPDAGQIGAPTGLASLSLDDRSDFDNATDFQMGTDFGDAEDVSFGPDAVDEDSGNEVDEAVSEVDVEEREDLADLLGNAPGGLNDIPPIRSDTPSSSASTPVDGLPNPFISALTPLSDLISLWPHPIPTSMREPAHSGARLNPHLLEEPSIVARTRPHLRFRFLPLLAHTLSSISNVARRPVELVLRVANVAIRHAENLMYARFRAWYIDHHPEATEERLADLDEALNPFFDPAATPGTIASALRAIDVDTEVIVHPQCRNLQCHHLFYSITRREDAVKLPEQCPECNHPLWDDARKPSVLYFPRRSLKSELEVVLRIPGVEEAVDKRQERKQKREQSDLNLLQADGLKRAGGKIYRHQDDGEAWGASPTSNPALTGCMELVVNLGADWANMSSRRSASIDSIGPITLQLANLPQQLRSSMACAMIMGITPGPKAPRAKNLWKFFLPLIMELRDSDLNGVWLRTPSAPNGRLVRVSLGVICCDRPAAVEVTGGPSFSAALTPCLRCLIRRDQLTDLFAYPFPNRHSRDHNLAVFSQSRLIAEAVAADQELHRQEQQAAISAGTQKTARAYPQYRQKEAAKRVAQDIGHLSALGLLPDYDKFKMCVFDPMHALLEGLVRTYMHKVLITGAHGSQGDGPLREDRDDDGDEQLVEGASDLDTEWGSDTNVDAARNIAGRFIAQMNAGEQVVSTPEERRTLKEGLARMGPAKRKRAKKMTTGDIEMLHALMASVQTPSSVARLHPQFGLPTAGTPSANHWRVFASIYGPLVIPALFAQRGQTEGRRSGGNPHLTTAELRALMAIFSLVTIALRSSISETQIQHLEVTIRSVQEMAFALHPTLHRATNFHVISHLPEDIRRFGPTYGWWTFLTERINFVVKNVNQSGGNAFQASVICMKAITRAREVASARMRGLELPDDASDIDKEAVREMVDLFEKFNHESASDVLEQVAFRFAEIDRDDLDSIGKYSNDATDAQPRGRQLLKTLDQTQQRSLQACLRLKKIETRTMTDDNADRSLPYISTRAIFWEGMTVGSKRFDCAEWVARMPYKLNPSEVAKLLACRNSLVECRSPDSVYACEDRIAITGVLCGIFEHAVSLADGTPGPSRLYGIIRKLKAFRGEDVYGYRYSPDLGVWTWHADALYDPVVILLSNWTVNSLRSLACIKLPLSIDDAGRPSPSHVLVTIPTHQH